MKNLIEKFLGLLKKAFTDIIFILHFILIVVPLTVVFLFFWKAPINIEKPKDYLMIEQLLKEEHPNCTFDDVVVNDVIYLEWMDSMNVIYPELRGKLYDETKTVFFNKLNENDTTSCAIVFEVENGFLKEKVGKPIYKVQNVKRFF